MRKHKKNRIITIFFFTIIFIGCSGGTTNEYWTSNEFYPGLYVELYKVYKGGVYGGDIIAYYFTDSINFKKYVGSVQDRESMTFEVINNKVVFKKISDRSYERGRIIQEWIFDLEELKKR